MEIIDLLLYLQGELRKRNGYQINDIQDVGGDYMINCPFHGNGVEKHPSFGILKEDKFTSQGKLTKGFGNCFACNARMNIHELVSRLLGMEQDEANEWLDHMGFEIKVDELYATLQQFAQEESIPIIPPKNYTKGYHPYMEQRGISPIIADIFELGFNYNSIVIPIKDRHGTTRMNIHRFIGNTSGARFHNTYGANKEELLHGRWEIMQDPNKINYEYLFVVESSIDMLVLWSNGYIGVATMQATPTKQQLDQINKLPIKKIIIATDNDEAGNKAVPIYLEGLKGKEIYRLKFEQGEKDIGDMSVDRLRRLEIEQIKSTGSRREELFDLPLG